MCIGVKRSIPDLALFERSSSLRENILLSWAPCEETKKQRQGWKTTAVRFQRIGRTFAAEKCHESKRPCSAAN
eukprot:12004366-Karenia_brevis.AAC.1